MTIRVKLMRSSAYLLVMTAALLAACSSMPTSGRIVPSRDTVVEIEKLNRRSDVVMDVLSVDRTEHRLRLNGAGGAVLSGRDLSPDTADQMIKIPFDQLGLVDYRIVSDQQRGDWRPSREIPKLPSTGPQDHRLGCEELDVELSRAGTIRWYARQSGAEPFTAHDARVQHAKTAGMVGIAVLLSPVLIATAPLISAGATISHDISTSHAKSNTPNDSSQSHHDPSPETRWAITAADRREIGLLEIKRDSSCPAHALPDSETTDLDILNQIESTRIALAAHQISDQEQMNQQTNLLNQFDPPSSGRATCPATSCGKYGRTSVASESQ
jgi:hypothetical protein